MDKIPFETGSFPTSIGHISACIGGDERYTDALRVTYDATPKRVRVVVTESSAQGGMDGPGGRTEPRASFDEWTPESPTPKQVLDLVKKALDDGRFSFKRYGRPSKRFCWSTLSGDRYGVSAALAKEALAYATWAPEPLDERLL